MDIRIQLQLTTKTNYRKQGIKVGLVSPLGSPARQTFMTIYIITFFPATDVQRIQVSVGYIRYAFRDILPIQETNGFPYPRTERHRSPAMPL